MDPYIKRKNAELKFAQGLCDLNKIYIVRFSFFSLIVYTLYIHCLLMIEIILD